MKQPYIIVDREQAKMIRNAGRSMQVRGPDGKLVGFIAPAPPAEEIAVALASLAEGPQGATFTTEQVLAHLRSLETP